MPNPSGNLPPPAPGGNRHRWNTCIAMAKVEGYFTAPGCIAARLNNPGNLRWSPKRFSRGEPPMVETKSGEFVHFAHIGAGFAALANDITAKALRGLTLAAAVKIYAPSEDNNDPEKYAEQVAETLGIDPHTVLQRWWGSFPRVETDFDPVEMPKPLEWPGLL